jgi:hypothetical protein
MRLALVPEGVAAVVAEDAAAAAAAEGAAAVAVVVDAAGSKRPDLTKFACHGMERRSHAVRWK